MKTKVSDVAQMLDDLNLPLAAARLRKIQNGPEITNFSYVQLLREVIEPQYIESMNTRFTTNLRQSSLINKSAKAENLKTGNGRVYYNDPTVQQILSFRFVENRQNVGVYGKTGAGKSYMLSACCVEACRENIRSKAVDYCDLLDELLILSQQDLIKYRKKVKYYAKFQLLFIDDFCISRYSEEGIKILYHLIKMRTDLGTSTMFSSQYSPDEWGKYLSYEENCYGKLDGIRRRLTDGYTILIERAK